MKSEKTRLFFLQHQVPQCTDDNLNNSLERLSLFQNNSLDLKNFWKQLSDIISLNKVYNIEF